MRLRPPTVNATHSFSVTSANIAISDISLKNSFDFQFHCANLTASPGYITADQNELSTPKQSLLSKVIVYYQLS